MEKIFPTGLFFKGPREGAPEFVKGSLGIKVEDFKKFLDEHVKVNGYVDLDFLEAKEGGKQYFALNTYKPEAPDIVAPQPPVEDDTDVQVPF